MKLGVVQGVLLACTLGVGIAAPASAQRPSVAVMPSLYFSAEAQSADNVTAGIARQFEGQGYSVVSADQARSAFESTGLNRTTHYADREALRFGRAANAQLVAYPRLLGVGIPFAGANQGFLEPAAVILLRVLNVRTGRAIYARQISHEFTADIPMGAFVLPDPVATATAAEVLQNYFERIGGSRLEASRMFRSRGSLQARNR